MIIEEDENPKEKDKLQANPKRYQPLVSFPHRLVKAKLEQKYGKFLEVLNKLEINISFLDPISEMPSYAKFLKDILSNKRKIEEHVTISFTKECIAIIQNKQSPKLSDPGSFSIPYSIGDVHIDRALCDLGASVSLMPLSICKKLQMRDFKPKTMSLQLADRSIKYLVGIMEVVPLKIGKFFIPCDFVVLDMTDDNHISIIIGRPFLATARAIIEVRNGKLFITFGNDTVDFNLTEAGKSLLLAHVAR